MVLVPALFSFPTTVLLRRKRGIFLLLPPVLLCFRLTFLSDASLLFACLRFSSRLSFTALYLPRVRAFTVAAPGFFTESMLARTTRFLALVRASFARLYILLSEEI